MIKFIHKFEELAGTEQLLLAWEEFLRGKRGKPDVQIFASDLMSNIIALKNDIVNETYRHGGYKAFNVSDPKPRNIHKASVRDRLVHHLLYRGLYPFFEKTFIYDSYSCRIGKGTHKAIERFRSFALKVGKNNTRTVWVLKGDIRKFFASIDHQTLLGILSKYIEDKRTLSLLKEIIESFHILPSIGLPLGNLTSQLLVNIYMNEFDQFVKNELKVKYYIRYADDFVVLSDNRAELEALVLKFREFLEKELKLELHPRKLSIKTYAAGVDFLGWVNFPKHRVLRNSTKRKMMRRINENPSEATIASYKGLLSHGNAHKLFEKYLQR